jgi:Zn-dependent protease with chaperone function
MDPFALQQAARTRTFRLVPLAAVAIIATAVATGLVFLLACWGVWLYFGDADLARDATEAGIAAFCHAYPQVVAACFVFSFLLIGIATLSKFLGLSSGDMLMKSIGATRLKRGKVSSDADADLARDRFLNVCEEMSIASGLDMPTVWVLENEGGVNALAAGTNPSAAAVCVTRGAL